jgi:outer membrane protein OmpA-like peptidoglycan-associated protein
MFAPWLDFSGGARFWSASIDRTDFVDTAEGRLKTFSVHPDLRAHLFRWKGVRPYALAGLSALFVTADVDGDESLEDALGGFRVGLDAGFGISTNRRALARRTRREFAEDVGNWTFTMGLGTWPIQRATRSAESPRAASRTPVTEQFAPVLDADDVPGSSFAGATGAVDTAERADFEETIRALREENRILRDDRDALQRELDDERARRSALSGDAPGGAGAATSEPAALARSSWTIPASYAFEPDRATLTEAGRDEVRRIAEELRDHPGVRLVVEGHTDSAGDALRNVTLSEERAAAVRAELIRAGIGGSRVRASGFGSTAPIAEDTDEGRCATSGWRCASSAAERFKISWMPSAATSRSATRASPR